MLKEFYIDWYYSRKLGCEPTSGSPSNLVIPPAVPPNLSLLRTSYMATHTDEQMEFVLNKFAKIGRTLGLIP